MGQIGRHDTRFGNGRKRNHEKDAMPLRRAFIGKNDKGSVLLNLMRSRIFPREGPVLQHHLPAFP